MRCRSCALAIYCLGITLASASAKGSEFYSLGQGRLAKAVSPDGATVLVSMGDTSAVGLWTPSTGLMQIASGEVFGHDIANNNVVVGLFCGSNLGSCYEAFRWTSGSGVQGIGALPGSPIGSETSDAFGISVDGSVVVGQSSSADGSQAYRWTIGGGMVGIGFLNTLEDRFSSAAAVSANGDVVVGSAGNDNIPQAFRWTQAAGMVGLGDLPGGSAASAATAVSANGQIVVGASESTSGTEAFRWTQATGMVGLGDLPGGDFQSTALATNTDGQIIVGESRGTLLNSEAFIWTESQGMRPLQFVLENEHGLGAALVGWQLFAAQDISNDGLTIVGYGQNPAGQFEGFVVVIPEPSALWLVIAGAAALVNARLVRRLGTKWVRRQMGSDPLPPQRGIREWQDQRAPGVLNSVAQAEPVSLVKRG